MENDIPDAALVDSFFLPGGILDPESYEEDDNEEKESLKDLPRPSSSLNLSTTSNVLQGVSSTDKLLFLSGPLHTSFDPNNPWAQSSPSFYQPDNPFQITATTTSTTTANTTTPPFPPPGFGAPPPPGFEAAPIFPFNNASSSYPDVQVPFPDYQGLYYEDEEEDEDEDDDEDDETSHGVPRELLQDNNDNSSYAGSSTSSLSNSSSSSHEDANAGYHVDHEAKCDNVHDEAREVEEKSGEDDEEDEEPDLEDESPLEDEHVAVMETSRGFDELQPLLAPPNPTIEVEQNAHTPHSQKSVRVMEDLSSPVSPPDGTTNDNGRTPPNSPPSSPAKNKTRKRRHNKKSKASPLEKEKIIRSSLSGDAPLELPSLEQKPVASSFKSSGVTGRNNPTLTAHENDFGRGQMVAMGFTWRLLTIMLSIAVEIYRAALNETVVDSSSLGAYIFFRYSHLLVSRVIQVMCLPHWISHFVTWIGIWTICTPLPHRDRTVLPLTVIRAIAFYRLLHDGFSHEHASIMRAPGCVRMLVTYLILVIRNGYWDSPLLWLSFLFQVTLALLLPSFDQLLIMVGLASIHCKRSLVMKSMKAELKTD